MLEEKVLDQLALGCWRAMATATRTPSVAGMADSEPLARVTRRGWRFIGLELGVAAACGIALLIDGVM